MAGAISNLSNFETEWALLGSIILDDKLIIKAIDSGIKANDFADESNGFVFDVMKGLYKSNSPIELVSIQHEFKKCNFDVSISDLTNMTSIAIPSNVEYYIKTLKALSKKRNTFNKVSEFLNEIPSLEASQIKSMAAELLSNIEQYDEVESLITDASDIKRVDINGGLSTGFADVDQETNGLAFGSLTILTGEPSSGKSTLLNQIIAENLKDNQRCMIYSGELTSFNVLQWFMRTVANESDLKEFKSRFGSYYDVTTHGEHMIRNWIKNRFYIFNEDSIASIENLCNTIEYLARRKNVKLVILDNMMTVENGNLEELEKQKALTKKIKQIARKYELCVILVAHPKKKQGKDTSYHMHDVSGASEVVNLADYEFLLTRKIEVDKSGSRIDQTHLAIMKNRITGRQGIKLKLDFDVDRKRFYRSKMELNKNYKYDENNQYRFVELEEVSEDVPF